MRLAAPLVLLALLAALAGCGSSEETTTGTIVPVPATGSTAQIRTAWERNPECERPPGASRWGCSIGSYRCQAVVVDRGWSVSCSKPGDSVAFTVRP